MSLFKIMHKKSQKILATQAKLGDSFMDRLIGLMFKSKMNGFDALILSPSGSIHTCFMKYNIDVVFLSRENKVIKIFEQMPPWRFTRLYFSAVKVIEFPGGKLQNAVQIGDEVEIVNV